MVCSLEIKVEKRDGGKSYMKDTYVTPPFRIVPVGQYKRDDAAYLMIMSVSPGLLDGDDHQIKIDMAKDATLQLQTQSYQRLFQMKDKSTQVTRVNMEEGANFSYVPHPVVPQNLSTFISENIIHMSKGSHFLLSDIITCGRKGSGEVFQYNHFQNLTKIYVDGKMVVKDNVLLQPKQMPISSIGLLEGFTHQGTLLYYNTKAVDVLAYIEYFHQCYKDKGDIEFGISQLQGDGFIIRILGNGAEVIFSIFKEVQQKLWEEQFLLQHK